jgi:hypothetical protein
MFIEGDPEDLWQRAWAALIELLQRSGDPTVTITDRVMAKAIQDLWINWRGTKEAFRGAESEFSNAALRKSFQVSYLANWKRRHELISPVTFQGYMPADFELPATIYHYRVVDYKVELVERRRLEPPPRHIRTPEEQAEIDAMLATIGRRPKYCTCSGVLRGGRCTCRISEGKVYRHDLLRLRDPLESPDASHSAVPGSENQPAPDRFTIRPVTAAERDTERLPLPRPLHLIAGPGEHPAGDVAPDAPGVAGGEQSSEPIERKVACCTCYECYCGRPCNYRGAGGEHADRA